MVRRLTVVVALGASLTLGACNMVRGAAADVNSAANCTEDLIKRGQC